MERWIMANDAPLVSEFGRANFRKLGKRGKLLVIAVVDPQATITNAYIENMKALARKFNAQTKAKVKETSNGRVSSFVCSFVRLFVCSFVRLSVARSLALLTEPFKFSLHG